jgi:predicted outer membrane lipoprotein
MRENLSKLCIYAAAVTVINALWIPEKRYDQQAQQRQVQCYGRLSFPEETCDFQAPIEQKPLD